MFVTSLAMLTTFASSRHTPLMPQLYRPDTGAEIGTISDLQLKFLIDNLEEEDTQDRDYYISRDTIEMFRDRGCDPSLLTLLEGAMGPAEDVDIAWREDKR